MNNCNKSKSALSLEEIDRIRRDPPRVMNIKEVAAYLGVSPRKIYYDLLERREQAENSDIGILRVEQLYPLRASELQARLAPYPKDVDLVWVQEEPWNMGAWYFMRARLPEILGNEQPLRCIARPESASPATGSRASHEMEQRLLIDEVFS